MFKVTEDIIYVGVNDHEVDLFEGQYDVPNGMAYNSYVVLDEKVAVFDTVDAHFKDEWLANLEVGFAGAAAKYFRCRKCQKFPERAGASEPFVVFDAGVCRQLCPDAGGGRRLRRSGVQRRQQY